MPNVSMRRNPTSLMSGPLRTTRKSLKGARRTIRRHWSDQEKLRRREMADLMQQRLLEALGNGVAAR